MTDTARMDPVEAFALLGRIKLADIDLDGVLALIADLANRTIPGAVAVSVTLVRDTTAFTTSSTSDLARELDEAQYEAGRGPCLDASAANTTFSVPEVAGEARWPEWAARALEHGVHSSLAIGLPIQEEVCGALNIYSLEPGTFDEDAIVVAQTFAGYAAVALANVHLYDVTASLAQHLQAAMESRALIEQAKGIIMGEHRCTPDEAFRILAKVSQDSNRKVRDVASALVARATTTRQA
jgi:GAF domain-containing protein